VGSLSSEIFYRSTHIADAAAIGEAHSRTGAGVIEASSVGRINQLGLIFNYNPA
jgi:hypothetical protein